MAEGDVPFDLAFSRQKTVFDPYILKEKFVLVYGFTWLGVEICRQLLQLGVGKIVLVSNDKLETQLGDLGVPLRGFTPTNRKERTLEKLDQWRASFQQIVTLERGVTQEDISGVQVVVMSGGHIFSQEALRLNEMCRTAGTAFVSVDVRGFLGVCLVDFGSLYTYEEKYTEYENVIESVKKREGGGYNVSFMGSLSELRDSKTEVYSGPVYQTTIDWKTSEFLPKLTVAVKEEIGEQLRPGFKIIQKSQYSSVSHDSLVTKIEKELFRYRFYNALKALEEFHTQGGSDGDSFERFIISKVHPTEDRDTRFYTRFANTWQDKVPPMYSLFSSIAAMEAAKALTHHFAPLLNQFQVVNELWQGAVSESIDSKNIYRALESLSSSNIYLIGAGAVGCEVLKNLALMKAATKGGLIKLYDDDTVGESNLHRQLLFLSKDVGNVKVTVAALSVLDFSQERIAMQPNAVFFDETKEISDGTLCVIAVVDSYESREEIDEMCKQKGVPMIEAGAGMINVNSIYLPAECKERYSSKIKAASKDEINCAPHGIAVTFAAAVDKAKLMYNSIFNSIAGTVEEQLRDNKPSIIPEAKMMRCLIQGELAGSDMASQLFDLFFKTKIEKEIDTGDSENLWEKHLRPSIDHIEEFRQPFIDAVLALHLGKGKSFDKDNEKHVDFIYLTAKIYCSIYQIHPVKDREEARRLAGQIGVASVVCSGIAGAFICLHLIRHLCHQPNRMPYSELRWTENRL